MDSDEGIYEDLTDELANHDHPSSDGSNFEIVAERIFVEGSINETSSPRPEDQPEATGQPQRRREPPVSSVEFSASTSLDIDLFNTSLEGGEHEYSLSPLRQTHVHQQEQMIQLLHEQVLSLQQVINLVAAGFFHSPARFSPGEAAPGVIGPGDAIGAATLPVHLQNVPIQERNERDCTEDAVERNELRAKRRSKSQPGTRDCDSNAPAAKRPKTSTETIPQSDDVIRGRQGLFTGHPGNMKLNKMIEELFPKYYASLSLPSKERKVIHGRIVEKILSSVGDFFLFSEIKCNKRKEEFVRKRLYALTYARRNKEGGDEGNEEDKEKSNTRPTQDKKKDPNQGDQEK